MTESDKLQLKKILDRPNFKKDALQIVVNRIFTDINGTVYDKNDAAIPDNLKTDYPVYVFGQYDFEGAYYLGLKNTPPPAAAPFLLADIYGRGNPFFYGFSGLADINRYVKPGDLITVYADNLAAPSWFIWVIQRCSNKSLGSILNNLPNLPTDPDYGYINVTSLDYYADNDEQWKQVLTMIKYDYLGLVGSDEIQPFMYRTPATFNNGFTPIRWKFRLDQYIGINTRFIFESDSITLTFQVEHRFNEFKNKNV